MIVQSNEIIDQVVESLRSIKALRKQMDLQEKTLLDSLYNHMKENEELMSDDGEIILTWKLSSDYEYFDNKKFRQENEELYNKYKAVRGGARRLILK